MRNIKISVRCLSVRPDAVKFYETVFFEYMHLLTEGQKRKFKIDSRENFVLLFFCQILTFPYLFIR